MSAYIYKLVSPKKFAWMDIQITPTQSICSKVFYLKFWYKPAALPSSYEDVKRYRKICDALTRQELKTRNAFKGIEVNYGIIVSDRDKGIGTPNALPGEYFGVYQVVNMKSERLSINSLENIISINDENLNLKYHKAFPLSKSQINHMKKDEEAIRILEQGVPI
jgi:hypothetical protein